MKLFRQYITMLLLKPEITVCTLLVCTNDGLKENLFDIPVCRNSVNPDAVWSRFYRKERGQHSVVLLQSQRVAELGIQGRMIKTNFRQTCCSLILCLLLASLIKQDWLSKCWLKLIEFNEIFAFTSKHLNFPSAEIMNLGQKHLNLCPKYLNLGPKY